MSKTVSGFSKLNKLEKIDWLVSTYFNNENKVKQILMQYWNSNPVLQDLHDDFIENTISNFYLPFGIAPNFVINGKDYTIPMAIEESSVVAAASLVAKFWSTRGGFKAEVISSVKIGQVHFMYEGDITELQNYFLSKKQQLLKVTESITQNMRNRGGGILDIELRDKTIDLENYYQLHVTFETADSMGANFINSCLEAIANEFQKEDIQIVMSILSNYVPNCIVRAEVSCPVSQLSDDASIDSKEFAEKFVNAIKIAEIEPYRAVTHNKGIMNGIDAVIVATGNDFRAVAAGVHAYASKNGSYSSLSHAKIENDIFTFWIDVPLAIGTIGGLTTLHPLVKFSLEMLGKPSAEELMKIVAVTGLAQNFAAVRSLTTTGIQQGHMKMHIMNILNQHSATKEEKIKVLDFFKDNTISHSLVVDYLEQLRN